MTTFRVPRLQPDVHRVPMPFSDRFGKGAAVVAAVAAVSVAAVLSAPSWREYQLSRQEISSLLREQNAHKNDAQFLGHLGKRLNAAQRFSEALPVLSLAVGLSPKNAAMRDEWAKAQMGTGHVADAFGQLKEFLAADPEAAEPPFLLGKFYVTQQAFGPAREMLEMAVKRAPGNGEAWSLLAHCRIKMGNHGGAEEALQKAIALRPTVAEDHLQLAVIYSTTRPDVANQEYLRAIALAPKNPVVHREYSRFLFQRSDSRQAEQEARKAVELDKTDAMAHLLLGRCLLALNQPREAVDSLLTAASLVPTDPNPAEGLRRAYRQVGDKENADLWDRRFVDLRANAEAQRKWQEATLAHPEDRHAHAMLASYLGRSGDVNGCAQQYALSLKTTPDNPRVLLATARALNDGGFAAEALPLARKARAGTQMNPEAFAVLGDILVNLGRLHEAAINYDQIRDWHADRLPLYQQKIEEAAAHLAASKAPAEVALREAAQNSDAGSVEILLNRALGYDPENTRALRALLKMQFAQGRQAEATETAKRLIAISPEDGLAHTLFCLLYVQQAKDRPLTGSEIQAIDQHLQIAQADSSVAPTVYYARGLVFLRQGKAQQAVESLEKARQLDPSALAVYLRLAEARKAIGDTAGAEQATMEFQRRTQSRSTAK